MDKKSRTDKQQGLKEPAAGVAPVTTHQGTSSVGEQLRQAREADGLTTEQAAAQMRLATHMIQDIENDDHSNIAQTFAKGYLRNYARLLNLNADALVAQYDATHQAEDRDPMYRSHIEKERAAVRAKSSNMKLPKMAVTMPKFNGFKLGNMSKQSKLRYVTYVIGVVIVLFAISWWSTHNPVQTQQSAPIATASLSQEPQHPTDMGQADHVTAPTARAADKVQPVKPAKQGTDQSSSDLTSKLNMDNY